MRVLGFGASNSRRSINARLARYALQRLRSHHVPDAEIDMLDLNDFEMPIYSIDREHSSGVPSLAQRFLDRLAWADRVIISFAAHNGAYTVAFKNVFDWASRIETKLYQGKPLLMLSTSPGGRGGASVLKLASERAGFQGGEVRATFSLPRFEQAFSEADGLTDPAQQQALDEALRHLMAPKAAAADTAP